MQRSIIHLDLDSFFVAVERLKDGRLVGKPVIVGGSGDRGVVAACSYEARRFGVHSAMPARLAKELCPEAIFIRGDMDSYSNYSQLVTELIVAYAPLVEKASIDEFYIDMTGMDRYIGCYQWASGLRRQIRKELGLITTMALSPNKTVSKVGVGEAKPNGQIYIPHGLERDFMNPLRVEKIPMIGTKTAEMLHNMGIVKVGTLAGMPLKVLQKTFGKNGLWMWEKANGIDFSPVVPYTAQKSMSKESTYSKDTTDVFFLRQELIAMVSALAYDLRQMREMTGCITVKIRYADFDTQTRQVALPYTSSDHVIRHCVLELFNKLYNRRQMVRLVGVRLSKLVAGGSQLQLFDNSSTLSPLYQAMDRVRTRYGPGAVIPASTIDSGKRGYASEFQKNTQ